MQKHSTHSDILKRLKRAEGHLKATIGMIEAQRECVDIAQQLQAVEMALGSAKRELIHDHIEHCLEDGPDAKAEILELKQLTKYL